MASRTEKAAEARGALAHLYRRAGFGARPEELEAAVTAGYAKTLDRLLDLTAFDLGAERVPPPTLTPVPDPLPSNGDERRAIQNQALAETRAMILWWLDRMVVSTNPLREKLTWFWHGHFATAFTKVREPALLYRQNQTLRRHGDGNFEELTQAVAKDPAMILWLDTQTNAVGKPNENFSRELMELFALGIGNYTEKDVAEGARAFTGWRYDRAADGFAFVSARHDDGLKSVLGTSGVLTGEQVVKTVIQNPQSPRFIVSKLWSHFAYPVAPSDRVVDELAPAFARNLDVSQLVQAVFRHPGFLSPPARTGLVKQPVEHLVGALRALNLRADKLTMLDGLREAGQMPFDPPDVGGWPQNGYWLGTASALARLKQSEMLAQTIDVSAIGAVPRKDRPAHVARMLSVGPWSKRTSSALAKVAPEPRMLLAAALLSPEYLLN
ncbi:MAG: DUF1800 domain-containing protein [Acidimicrobiales bacterium]